MPHAMQPREWMRRMRAPSALTRRRRLRGGLVPRRRVAVDRDHRYREASQASMVVVPPNRRTCLRAPNARWRSALAKGSLLGADVDVRVAIRRREVDVPEPAADHVDLDAGLYAELGIIGTPSRATSSRRSRICSCWRMSSATRTSG